VPRVVLDPLRRLRLLVLWLVLVWLLVLWLVRLRRRIALRALLTRLLARVQRWQRRAVRRRRELYGRRGRPGPGPAVGRCAVLVGLVQRLRPPLRYGSLIGGRRELIGGRRERGPGSVLAGP
ncbi:hypothetical protein, partial [Streptomyces sp. SID4917]|uniref:hypothetical protein n=1 Tax=Streptomyces sp. SID4917 TaxID=2690269 RepID=UPI0019273E40